MMKYKNLLSELVSKQTAELIPTCFPASVNQLFAITGSKGKTSTSYYLNQLIPTAAKFISPHCYSVRERVTNRQRILSHEEFADLFDRTDFGFFGNLVNAFLNSLDNSQSKVAIVEVGIGGLMDTTNIPFNKQKVGILTSVELEHCDLLGGDKSDIIYEKLGLFGDSEKIIMPSTLDLEGIDKIYGYSDKIVKIHTENISDKFRIDELLARRAALETGYCSSGRLKNDLPGRCKEIKNYFIDSAHTTESIQFALEEYKQRVRSQSTVLVFCQTKRNRNYGSFIELLKKGLSIGKLYYLPASSSLDYSVDLSVDKQSYDIGVSLEELGFKILTHEEFKQLKGNILVIGSEHGACLAEYLLGHRE